MKLDLIEIMRPVTMPTTVYPLYIASRIMRSLKAADTEGLIASVDGFDTLGNSRYAVRATDINGAKYRITVEVVS